MRNLSFSEGDLAIIREQRFGHPHPRVQQKLEVLWLKSKALPHAEIARLTGLGRRTVQRYLQEFHHGGLDATLEVRFAGRQSALADHTQRLAEHFAQHPPRDAREAQRAIARLTGVHRGLTQVRHSLKKNLA